MLWLSKTEREVILFPARFLFLLFFLPPFAMYAMVDYYCHVCYGCHVCYALLLPCMLWPPCMLWLSNSEREMVLLPARFVFLLLLLFLLPFAL